jgi:hypothetical protein
LGKFAARSGRNVGIHPNRRQSGAKETTCAITQRPESSILAKDGAQHGQDDGCDLQDHDNDLEKHKELKSGVVGAQPLRQVPNALHARIVRRGGTDFNSYNVRSTKKGHGEPVRQFTMTSILKRDPRGPRPPG